MREFRVWTRAAAALLVALCLTRPADAQRAQNPSGVRVGAQIVTATVIAPVAFVAGGLATRALALRAGASEDGARNAAYIGAWTLAGLGASVVPPLLLRGGNYPASAAGTAVGGVASIAVVWAGRHLFHDDARCGVVCTLVGATAFALPATGATLFYNNSR
ncbi:MAG: hypothetical protein U0132_00555 [Gemmatimonadaceae bacterium]